MGVFDEANADRRRKERLARKIECSFFCSN